MGVEEVTRGHESAILGVSHECCNKPLEHGSSEGSERTPGPGQLSFADVAVEGRRRKLETKRGRHLAMIDDLVPWEDFRPVLETVWRKPKRERRSAAGRKPWDAVLMFKAIVLGALIRRGARARDGRSCDSWASGFRTGRRNAVLGTAGAGQGAVPDVVWTQGGGSRVR